MAIRLETSKRTGIQNEQDTEISDTQLKWISKIPREHPQTKPRTTPSPLYNCHGLTFASRRTRIIGSREINTIINDDEYEEIQSGDVLAGDIVIYYSNEGDPNHSGTVVEAGGVLLVPIICSKWGNAGEFIHALYDCPNLYGPNQKFFRCRL